MLALHFAVKLRRFILFSLSAACACLFGTANAEKIIKDRPYQRNDELVQKKILPRTTYEQIRDKIEAKQK